jgi:FAD/FMN-containing dehydrogenase
MATLAAPALETIDLLRAQLVGRAITPGDADYDEARKAWNLSFQHHPALIVQAQHADDVAAAVRFAREAGLPVAVQSTGHGIARPADGALLIITSAMNTVEVNAETRTAWVEAGVKWGQVLEKAQAFGLAPLLGSSPEVGAIGYTLGGGMGWLARHYGMAVDSVQYFEVVTADGERVHASETENPDLFWGLRGGGGSLGVVTGMAITLYPVTTIYGGSLIYPAEQAKALYTFFRQWIANAPDELTSSIALMNLPPLPQIPEFLRGRSVIMVRAAYSGEIEQGAALIQPWLDFMQPIANLFRPMPFSEVATISNDPTDPAPGLSTGVWMRDLTDEAIDTIIQYGLAGNGSPLVFTEIRHAGGAIAKNNADATAYSNREAPLLLQMLAITPTPQAFEGAHQFQAQFQRAVQSVLTGGVYMNFLEGEDKQTRTKDAYTPEKYRRLQAIKAKYDPENVFSHSFDVRPAQR